jgi:tetratricopeptide (TPR) repeat protein
VPGPSPEALRSDAERLLRLPGGSDLLLRWSPASANQDAAFAALGQLVLALLREHPTVARRVVERVANSRAVSGEFASAKLRRLRAHAAKACGDLALALEDYERAAAHFAAEGDEIEHSRTVIGWADALALAGETQRALALIEHDSKSTRSLDAASRARLEGTRATVYYLAGRLDRARALYRGALRRARRNEQGVDVAVCTFNLGNVYLLTGRASVAERNYERARLAFEKAGLELAVLQCRYSIAAARLHRGDWPFAIAEFDRVAEQLRERGDRRGAAAIDHDAAELLASLGADPVAEVHARRARADFAAMGLLPEQARAAALHGHILARSGRLHDAGRRFDEASSAFDAMGRTDVTDRLRLERIALAIARNALEELDTELKSLLRRADAARDHVRSARCHALLAEWALRAKRPAFALSHAQRAHHATRRAALRVLLPEWTLLVARAHAAAGHRKAALQWAERAVKAQERIVRRSASHADVLGLGHARRRLVAEAVEIVLAAGGQNAATRAVSLLMRARVGEVVGDLLRGGGRSVDADLAAALARLRERLLADTRGVPDVRSTALHGEIEAIERRLRARPDEVRRTLGPRGQWETPVRWSRAAGGRPVIVFDRSGDRWRAYVVGSRGSVTAIELPRAAATLREAWIPLRMMLEAIAHAPTAARKRLIARTEDEARAALRSLHAAFWLPLVSALAEARELVVVGQGVAAGIALEAAWLEADPEAAPRIARVSHPALLLTSAPAEATRALLVEGATSGAKKEIAAVGARLRGTGWTTEEESTRAAFAAGRARCGLVHVAAHGSYHRSRWIYNGLQLRDGWLGFEQLHARRVGGALLYFDSCESGLANEAPGAELDGWATAGFAAGAHELVLNLWKVDDRSAQRSATAFYEAWCSGATAADAAHDARARVRGRFAHPFHWAGTIVNSRRPFVPRR